MFASKIYHQTKCGRSAFTLIEVLGAILIFAFMMLGISSTLQSVGQLSQKVKTRQASSFSGFVALDKITRDLRLAYNERVQKSRSFFRGRELSLGADLQFTYFESPLLLLFERRTTGIYASHYYLQKNENGTFDLRRSQRSISEANSNPNQEGAGGELVASGVLNFRLEYYYAQNDQWMTEWDSKGANTNGLFPKAIKVLIETVDPSIPQVDWKEIKLALETKLLLLNELEDR